MNKSKVAQIVMDCWDVADKTPLRGLPEGMGIIVDPSTFTAQTIRLQLFQTLLQVLLPRPASRAKVQSSVDVIPQEPPYGDEWKGSQ